MALTIRESKSIWKLKIWGQSERNQPKARKKKFKRLFQNIEHNEKDRKHKRKDKKHGGLVQEVQKVKNNRILRKKTREGRGKEPANIPTLVA